MPRPISISNTTSRSVSVPPSAWVAAPMPAPRYERSALAGASSPRSRCQGEAAAPSTPKPLPPSIGCTNEDPNTMRRSRSSDNSAGASLTTGDHHMGRVLATPLEPRLYIEMAVSSLCRRRFPLGQPPSTPTTGTTPIHVQCRSSASDAVRRETRCRAHPLKFGVSAARSLGRRQSG